MASKSVVIIEPNISPSIYRYWTLNSLILNVSLMKINKRGSKIHFQIGLLVVTRVCDTFIVKPCFINKLIKSYPSNHLIVVKGIFSLDYVHYGSLTAPNGFPPIPSEHLSTLDTTSSDSERCDALFSMSSLKSLSCDRLHVQYFQSQWSTVGSLVSVIIHDISMGGVIDPELNKTTLVIIPKTTHPLSLFQILDLSAFSQ
ncbi:hypothetical protein V6N13_073262 [Hibiscus sabdariffa]